MWFVAVVLKCDTYAGTIMNESLYHIKMKIKSFPNYLQLDAMDCGPTCLRIIAKYITAGAIPCRPCVIKVS